MTTASTTTRTSSARTPIEAPSHRTAWIVVGLLVATLAVLGISFAAYQAAQPPSTPASTGSYDPGTTLQRSAGDVVHGAGSVVVTGAGQQVR